MSKKIILILLSLFVCVMALSGCTERVPPGYAGMVMKPGGLTGDVLSPGNYSCWNRDKLILIETKEMTKTEELSVLCADDLNFKFDLKVRARLRKSASKNILDVLNRQGANIVWKRSVGILKADILYDVYVKPSARPIARGIVSKYDTTQIRGEREAITRAIQEQLLKAVKGTPLEITLVATSNFDYPDVITRAVEKRREREISIQEEKAKQAVELLKADNRLKIAQKMKAVRAAEAEADSVAIQILGKSLTDKYLQLKRIERDMVLYRRVQQGDKVIITNGNPVIPIVGMNK